MAPILHLTDFTDLVGETFILSAEGVAGPLEATLVQASEWGGQPAPDAPRIPFSLHFKLPAGTKLDQGLVHLRHARLNELAIFLVPIGADEGGWFMEACFN